MEHIQLELFSDRSPAKTDSTSTGPRRLAPIDMSDADLIAAIPDSVLSDASALAAEAGRRRLTGAVSALIALCNRFVGFGVDRIVPEQVAALEALAAIGGIEASRLLEQMFAKRIKRILQGPTLAVATAAASRLGVIFPADIALELLRDTDPAVRAAACECVRARSDVRAKLIELLDDRVGDVAIAAACALGRMGFAEARDRLKRYLKERPSPRVIEALAVIADEEAIVLLARRGRDRPDLAHSILSALDECDHPRAGVVAAGLKRLLFDAARQREPGRDLSV